MPPKPIATTVSSTFPRTRIGIGRLTPLARAIAVLLAAGGVTGTAQAQRAFSPAWFGAMGANQSTATQTGMLSNGKPVSILTNPSAQQQQANAQLQRSINNLNLAARAIAAKQAAQAAANDMKVPDGLADGGLKVDTNSLTAGWLNAKALDKKTGQTTTDGKTTVTIEQTADKAILNWETFNVGKNTTVQFDQQSDWAVLNRVNDPAARPSQIQGQIKAPGTVLIVNRNGIVFSGSSQVNVRNLVAAATQFTDAQFQGNGIYGTDDTTPSFTNAGGNIMVEAGAQLNTAAPASVTQGGGYVLLMGSEIHNDGAITTPRGQVELAAGDSFVIRHGYGTDSNTTSTTRGNEIAPQLNGRTDVGTVENTGLLMASEGDITLAGHDVRQDGVAVATTTVNQRGTIHLLNSAKDATGSVTLGANAVTAIVLQDDGTTALNSQRSALIADSAKQNQVRAASITGAFDNLSVVADREDQSRIEIVSGNTVDFAGGGLTLATGGQIAVGAKGRTQVEDQAQLDVAGAVGVSLAMSSNNVQVNVQGNEQRDAPINRDSGTLNNSNVWVDTRRLLFVPAGTGGYASDRYYTAGGLLEVSGYLGTQGHTIGEWAATGGTITLGGNEVVTRSGAVLNLSGGSYDVQGGMLHVSWVKGADGRLYTVDDAPADMAFTGVYQGFEALHPRWGDEATQNFRSPLIAPSQMLQDGYTVGRDAGQLIINAPTAVLDGNIDANVYQGPLQIQRPDAAQTDNYLQSQLAEARPAGLALAQYTATGLVSGYQTDVKIGDVAPLQGELGVNDALPEDRTNTVWLDAATLNAEGLGSLSLVSFGGISIDAPLQLAPGARISLTAPIVDIAADITAPSGSLTATNMLAARSPVTTPDGLSSVTLEEGVVVDLRGLWTNVLLDPSRTSGLAYVDGGNATFDSSGSVILSRGSVIDVSSGAAILANGKTVGGKGGNVTLVAGDPLGNAAQVDATLTLDGSLRAMGVTGGGKLTVSSPSTVLLGAQASIDTGILAAGTPAPVDVALGQPLTIAAGEALPISADVVYTTVPLDVPAPVDIPMGVAPKTPTAADWVLPANIVIWNVAGNRKWNPGDTMPAGTIVGSWGFSDLPAGTVIPSNVFPNGVPVLPYSISYIKGEVLPAAMTYPLGTRVVAGSVLPVTVALQPPESINPDLLRSGFANYDINSSSGVLVPTGTSVAPVMPVYQFTPDSRTLPTGSDPSEGLSAWLPPLFTEDPVDATLTQRGGASLTLRSVTKDAFGVLVGGGPIDVQPGATITVDPGQSIQLDAFSQLTVDGGLTAHGGNITLTNEALGDTEQSLNVDASGNVRGFSMWIGDGAKLDVSGEAYGAQDARGRRYGMVTNGGAISLSGAGTFVVVRPGAELDADGADIVVDPVAGTTADGALSLPSNGGSIALKSNSGLYLDGNMHAFAGGMGAAGGSLSIALNTPALTLFGLPAKVAVAGVMTIVQSMPESLLPDGIAPDTAASSYTFGQVTVSADAVKAGGFGSLSLNADDYMTFAGDVSLALDQSLMLTAGAFTSGPALALDPDSPPATATGHVSLSAPYLLLSGSQAKIPDGAVSPSIRHPLPSAGSPTDAIFEANADQIDIRGAVVFSAFAAGKSSPGYRAVDLNSQGDIRFLADSNVQPTSLMSDWDISLNAAQIYPATGVKVIVAAGMNNPGYDATLSLGRTTDTVPDAPLSVLGNIMFAASTIEQGGVVRAPFGNITFGSNDIFINPIVTDRLDLLPGSLASVSMAGLVVPYGGTIDGVTYSYNGVPVTTTNLSDVALKAPVIGINLAAGAIDVQDGATLDLSGGGTLAGAGFISGRGGSVNILTTPLVNANPANTVSHASDKVYAIVPGYASGYAPMAPENGAGDPAIGQQVTIGDGVPGLPAGTYTLMPSNYALLPGAYRVEVGQALPPGSSATGALPDGSYLTSGVLGIANTGVRNSTPSTLLVMPASVVRTHSQYDEESFSDFQRANAAQFGGLRPLLPEDGKTLMLSFQVPVAPESSALTFDGTARLQAGQGGFAGQVITSNVAEIYADAPSAGFLGTSVSAAALDAIGAPRLLINGSMSIFNGVIDVNALGGYLAVRDGVTLQGGEIFLVGNDIEVGQNVTLSTIGQGAAPFDSMSTGMPYIANGDTVLALSNGALDFAGSSNTGSGAITIGAGSALYSEGTLTFATNGNVSLDSTAHFGSRNITLAVGSINIGSDADIAAAGGPDGLPFDQSLFDVLVHGDSLHGAPALEKITLAAGNAINLFGNASLDATGTGVDLVLNTPAIYGWGAAGDEATISAGKITWNGEAATTPPAISPGGAGTGLGTLNLKADEIDLGQFVSLDTTSINRVVYGFNNVNLTASEKIVAAGNSSLFVYQAPSTTAGDVFGQSGTGGNLTLSTPLLTGVQKSIAHYTAGGVLTVTSPDGFAPSTASSTVAGAEIDLSGDSVAIDSTILLPSGKLQVDATHGVTLGADSRIDLSGQLSMIQTATVYGFGGTAIFNSEQGGVAQAAGSVIDVSATQANAGSITIGAGNGAVALGGTLKGVADDGYVSGDFSVTAATISDFTGLNAILTQGGIFDARSFDLKTGDLIIGDGVKAHNVNVSVDGGDLTVNGTIDASGTAPGTIRLAAKSALTLSSTSNLDAHGTQLQTDSYGQAIEAKNRGNIELAAAQGTLTLASGATMDVSAPDGIARGQITLNASRGTIGGADVDANETLGDVRIDASGPLTIKGAQSVAVNGFWTYKPTDTYGTIVQDNGDASGATVSAVGHLGLDQVDARSQLFINAALANTNLQNRLGGLKAYADAFHLRPGVEIDSATPNGTLTVAGDIDLAGFRYASLNAHSQKTGIYGSGEPGALVIRAGGDLDIVGSISDGFMPAPTTTDDAAGWMLQAGKQTGNVETLMPITLSSGTTIPNTAGLTLRYDIPINPATIVANALIPTQVTLASDTTIPAGTRLTADVLDGGNNVLYHAGTVLATATTLAAGSKLAAGSVLPSNVNITAMNWQAGNTLGIFTGVVTLSSDATVPFEGIIPAGTNVQMAAATAQTRPAASDGTQGSIDAIAAMLPQGSLSWSIRGVAGADLEAADTRIVRPASVLKAAGVSGNITLVDSHLGIQPTSSVEVKKYVYFYYGNPYYTNSPTDWGCTHYGNTSCGVAYVTQTTPGKVLTAAPSVLRTGAANLDLVAGGSFDEQTLFGVYTAGTQSAPVLAPDGGNPYNQPRGRSGDTVFNGMNTGKEEAVDAAYQAWYPEHGGDVLISAQNDVTGRILVSTTVGPYADSDVTSNWLWRQGGGGLATDPTAWWINFGTYTHVKPNAADVGLVGFQGIGTLGGGNLTVVAGRNAGLLEGSGSSGLDLAVASTGRVLPDGTLLQTGGGDLTLKVNGTINDVTAGSFASMEPDYFGSITDLRGNISVNAGAIGTLAQNLNGSIFTSLDPRTLDPTVIKRSSKTAGPVLIPGDGMVSVTARGDLVIGGAGDAGMTTSVDQDGMPYTLLNADGTTTRVSGGGQSSFTLWTPNTAIALYSAGGDVAPLTGSNDGTNDTAQNTNSFYPGTLIVAAANGDIRFAEPITATRVLPVLELMPSPVGQLELLAAGSIYGSTQTVEMSGAAMSSLATPFHPLIDTPTSSNASSNSAHNDLGFEPNTPIAFGPDTPTGNLHAGDSRPAQVYAGVDIDDLALGSVNTMIPSSSFDFAPSPLTWYGAAKPFEVIAGRDIVGLGSTPDVFVNNTPADVSFMHAGRDILYQSVTVAGPGVLDIQAGRNLYQGFYGKLDSAGLLFGVDTANRSGGADIAVAVGVGANGPDYSDFAKLYFDAANQLPAGTALADSGKVVHAYDQELLVWLQQRFGYTGTSSDALAYFLALPTEQQGVFVRQTYYAELTAGGREFNDPSSVRFQSYLRGRDAIATLFPQQDAQGKAIDYSGGITMFSGNIINSAGAHVISDAGIHTDFGGDIQILNPGGQTLVGVEGIAPGAGAGLITQGEGDIDIYSEGSILLGQSRIMTTFGGAILAWSATGDINAGRGSKTTVLFTPPRRVYDDLGDVTLSPQVPSTGAGIATLAPIPEVPAGDVDLIAPLGTIDAGEAGIRVSGNVNLAALQVVNAANIQVQGKATGLPVVATVNVGALTNASAAAAQATIAAQDVVQRERVAARQALPSVFTVRVLGFGNEPLPSDNSASPPKASPVSLNDVRYDPHSAFQVLGQVGDLSPAQLARLTEAEQSRLPGVNR